MLIFLLRKVTLRGHINSLKWRPHPEPPWTKGGGTQAWHSVYSVLCTKETQNPPTKWILLYTVHCTVYSRINSVKSLYAVTPTPYYECTQFVDSVKSLSFSETIGFFGPIAYIHSTELVWLRWVTLRSTKISIKWLWPVKVTLKVIKRRLMIFCWSFDEGPLK
jgi:hypothetical protein